jgi:hypothetical protein
VEHGQTCCGAFRKPISLITKHLDQVKFGRAQRTMMQGLAPRTLRFLNNQIMPTRPFP